MFLDSEDSQEIVGSTMICVFFSTLSLYKKGTQKSAPIFIYEYIYLC